MKKLLILLTLICSVVAFTSCDKETKTKYYESPCPKCGHQLKYYDYYQFYVCENEACSYVLIPCPSCNKEVKPYDNYYECQNTSCKSHTNCLYCGKAMTENADHHYVCNNGNCVTVIGRDNIKKGAAYMAENAKKEGVKTTASGLQYEVLSSGAEGGKKPTEKSTVVVNYVGKFIDGKQFDSGTNATFPLSSVIAGFTEGIQLMKEGDKFRLTMPYNLAYGTSNNQTIPAGSTLVFEVELVSVK